MKRLLLGALVLAFGPAQAADSPLRAAIARDYTATLAPLFEHLHRHPELSFLEVETAKRMAQELRSAGFEVSEGVGGTGVVAILKNGKGPLVMMRADMDGLPVEEKSGLPYASTVVQKDTVGRMSPVAHSCGHDVHMTSLVGTAHQMAARRGEWAGTLMLIAQPAEERTGGALAMMKDQLWTRFGKPDYAIALHVTSEAEEGKIDVSPAPYSGVDTLEINIKGVGTHGASPHLGKDPIVLGAQIVLALQTIITRDLAPREPGLITVGSFHGGSKSNIIGDNAKLELTVRTESPQARELVLAAITRVTLNTARAAGMPENLLPEIKATDAPAPPIVNDVALSERLKKVWADKLGTGIFSTRYKRGGMGAEDYPAFVNAPYIPSVYYRIGGTSEARFVAAEKGGPAIAANHSPLFRIEPEQTIRTGVETSVLALLDLLKK